MRCCLHLTNDHHSPFWLHYPITFSLGKIQQSNLFNFPHWTIIRQNSGNICQREMTVHSDSRLIEWNATECDNRKIHKEKCSRSLLVNWNTISNQNETENGEKNNVELFQRRNFFFLNFEKGIHSITIWMKTHYTRGAENGKKIYSFQHIM